MSKKVWAGLLLLGSFVVSAHTSAPASAWDEDFYWPLGLRADTTARPVVVGQAVELKATFRAGNRGTVHMYVPPNSLGAHFPRWRLTHADGRVFEPHPSGVQCTWPGARVGRVLSLEPGSERAFHTHAALFVALGPDGLPLPAAEALPLPLGRYGSLPSTATVLARCRSERTMPHGRIEITLCFAAGRLRAGP